KSKQQSRFLIRMAKVISVKWVITISQKNNSEACMILKKRTMFSLDQGRASNEALKNPAQSPAQAGL
ncbi:hypothetical protein, partial [Pseudoflavonifractor capillosus]|uniref:hypothetical protein n=1 Tax=Pseudoflavonifractor capillosus TaxID=106588 RepID=UPI0019565BA9